MIQEIARSALRGKNQTFKKQILHLSILISSAVPLLEFSGTCSIRKTVSKKVTFTLLRTSMKKQEDRQTFKSNYSTIIFITNLKEFLILSSQYLFQWK